MLQSIEFQSCTLHQRSIFLETPSTFNKMTKPIILILSGWSDGPLSSLYTSFPEVKFLKINIPTPPAGINWLLNPWLFLIVCVTFAIPSLFQFINGLHLGNLHIITQVITILSLLYLLRIIVARIVRYAIQDGVKQTLSAIEQYKPIAIVGFSFGGGVLYKMLDQCKVPALLLAPTIAALSSVGSTEMKTYTSNARLLKVAIVAGDEDPFCPPSQKKVLQKIGCQYYAVDDDHVLMRTSTRTLTNKILRDLLSET